MPVGTSTALSSPTYPRHARLSGAASFARVFRKGKRTGDRFFTVIFRPGSDDAQNARLGFAIARKRIPTAVARNRLKRVVRESFRHRRRQLPVADMVVMATGLAARTDNDVLRESLDRHWQKVKQQCASR
jgi:ribonuclease P protein component